jgi:Calreticulin family
LLSQIPDPTAVKPDDWDVPPQIIDPSANKPENWLDDEEDMIPGECEITSSCNLIN